MIYVVKVGDFYVKSVKGYTLDYVTGNYYIESITLSKEIKRNFNKNIAGVIARLTNGTVEEIADQVTMDDEKYKQLSIFDDEVINAKS